MTAPTSVVRHERTAVEPSAVVPADFALASIVLSAEAQLQALLPQGHTIERVLVELYNVTRKNPQLLNARAEQLIPALCDALSFGGVLGRDVYLAPFKNTRTNRVDVTVMVDYKFEAELVCLAGGAKSIQAFNWYAHEPFDYQLGSGAFVRHKKLSPSARGAWVGSYAVADIGPGALPIPFVMFAEEVEALRMRSRSWSDKALAEKNEKGPVDWYGPKSCVHRVVKLLPKKPALRAQLDRIAAAERLEFGDDSDQITTVEPAAHAASSSESAAGQPAAFDIASDLDEDPSEVAGGEMSIEEATAIEVQRRLLGTYRNSALLKIRSEAQLMVDKEGDSSKYVRLLVAVRLILEARERGQLVEPSSKNI